MLKACWVFFANRCKPFDSFCLLGISLIFAGITWAGDPDDSRRQKAITDFEEHFRDGRSLYGTIEQRMHLHRVPGLSIAVIKDRQLIWAKGYGLLSADASEPVNSQTVFSVGSVSKLVTALATLRLVSLGKLKLDEDVNQYLTWWQVPSSPFTQQQPVTLRHIMSHTAGFTVHGFPDFQPGELLPTVLDTLNGRAPAKHGPVVVDFTPGTQFRYSGGGTTVQQLILEETTDQDFPMAVQQWVFQPLSMSRSTFQNPLPASHGNIAKAHDRNGKATALPRGWESMPEMAASGLWTTPSDLAQVLMALIYSYQGGGRPFLDKSLARDMMTAVGPSKFGLGPQLYGEHFFGHGGSNNSYKAQVMAHLETGDGIVVLTNGANGRPIIEEIIATMKRIEKW